MWHLGSNAKANGRGQVNTVLFLTPKDGLYDRTTLTANAVKLHSVSIVVSSI